MSLNRLVVTKSNALICSSYILSVNEQRLILACAAQVDSRKHLARNNEFFITVKDFAEFFGAGKHTCYDQLKETANNLYKRSIDKIEGLSRSRMRWVYKAKYIQEESAVVLGFSPEIAPYLSSLNKRFTTYKLSEIADLKSGNSIRIYEMMMQFRDNGKLIISVENFRERLGITCKYTRYSNLKARVIDKVIQEISTKTNYDVTCEVEKRGHKVKNLHFYFKSRKPNTVIPITNPTLPI
ncbi:MAG: replication initiation protein [Sedimenticola sp.]